ADQFARLDGDVGSLILVGEQFLAVGDRSIEIAITNVLGKRVVLVQLAHLLGEREPAVDDQRFEFVFTYFADLHARSPSSARQSTCRVGTTNRHIPMSAAAAGTGRSVGDASNNSAA